MDRIRLISELHSSRLVAVVRSKSADDASALARAAAEGGIKFVEITFSVPGALDVIKELAARKDIHVGAGTVLAPQQAERAIGAGAEFVVSPSLELNLVGICHMANVACFPGAATPTEIVAAQRAHADLVKIFPADLAGGPYFIRQMRGPFPDVRFMVSGGVSLKNVTEYVRVGVTGICLGSVYLETLLAEKGKKHFIKEMKRFVKLVAKAQAKKPTSRKSKR
ncbi:MAG TPA: bifunctional 4-hydroxy-2-oxoglutarate aldolase/2-dehydro-3-deoxy-phosphogluconate aldolase [Candidatus Binatia bacterium]|nr:bifunctional 4-hydroxy-2-oxoglutarate aldolase/2-dehydro-3-deoxy-phosphogluconate aldolase [Candidatus Binatia bacterium]